MNNISKEDKLLLALLDDKFEQCEEQYIATHTSFLDMHQRTIVEQYLRENKKYISSVVFFGGFDDAERVRCYFIPEYDDIKNCHDMAAIKVTYKSGGRKLNHRDYLGSLLGLGIKREKVGDIIVNNDETYIIVDNDIAEYLSLNYNKAGRTELAIEIVDISEISIVEIPFKIKEDTVASLRLDNIISSAFSISRSKAVECIKRGLVFVNNVEIIKPDKEVTKGDKLVLRGKGKAYLNSIGGTSRKGRIYVEYKVY